MKLSNVPVVLLDPVRRRWRSRAIRVLLAEFVKPGDLVFDVGANVGDMSREFLALGARVVAFEPQQQCRERLAKLPVTVDPRALSDREGEAVLQIPQASTIASIAPDWIQAVKRSGRFAEFDWTATENVRTGTLDAAIQEYGEPAFCKIDVEGNEEAVIRGLSAPLRALSLEFTPEHRDGLVRAVGRLGLLGTYEWNFAPFDDRGDPARFEFIEWITGDMFTEFLRDYTRRDAGNAYGRLCGERHDPGA